MKVKYILILIYAAQDVHKYHHLVQHRIQLQHLQPAVKLTALLQQAPLLPQQVEVHHLALKHNNILQLLTSGMEIIGLQ